MPAGEAFTQRQSEDIERAIAQARTEGNVDVSVYVGTLGGDPAVEARRLHAQLSDAASVALIAVDPATRHLEIVTGSALVHRLDDRAAALAALSMTSAFSAGDIAGGIATGVRMLGEHARAPRILHND